MKTQVFDPRCGGVAQLGERCVRNAEVGSSILLLSTTEFQRSRDTSRLETFFYIETLLTLVWASHYFFIVLKTLDNRQFRHTVLARRQPTKLPYTSTTMQQQETHSYWRSDITGLRALAVLPVLIFHAWPALLPGGFVGVDVFFVISGYLISGILFRQLQRTGRIDFTDFYAKRIRRIIPNLLCVLSFTAAVGWFFLTRGEYRDLGRQIYSSAFFYQNFRLLKDLGDYFAADSSVQPLLHLWSLAIEEQFYIVFPLLCALVWKLRANVKALGCVVLLVTFGSFVACLLVEDQAFRFYFPLTRFWELGVGIVLSYAQHFGIWRPETQSELKRNVLSLLGGALLILSLFIVREKNFPGVEALIPTLGAFFILSASPKAFFNRFLALKPVVFIGLISYSLYLWHWPLIAYANIIEPQHEQWVPGVLLIVAFFLSVLSYRYVETPFRTIRAPRGKKLAVTGLLAGLVAVTVFGQWLRQTEGVRQRNSDFLEQIETFKNDWPDRRILHNVKFGEASVLMNKKEGFPQILFIGDSHAEQYIPRILKLAEERNMTVGVIHADACFVAHGVISKKKPCQRAIQSFGRMIRDPRLRRVVWIQKWGGYLHSEEMKIRADSGDIISFSEGGFKTAIDNQKKLFKKYDLSVHVVLDVPWDESRNVNGYDPLLHISRLRLEDWKGKKLPLPKDGIWLDGNNQATTEFSAIASIVDPVSFHCPDGLCDLLHYRDDDHLRASYVRDHAVWIDSIFDDAKREKCP